MIQWWRERSAREQALMLAVGAMAACLAAYQFVLAPLSGYRAAAADSYARAVELLSDVESGAAAVHAIQSASQRRQIPGDGSLRTAASGTAREIGLPMTRIQPLEDGGIDIWVDGVPPMDLFRWIAALHDAYGVAVKRATIQKDAAGATVSAQISLSKGTP